MTDFPRRLADLQQKLDYPELQTKLAKLTAESESPDLWQDQSRARNILQQLEAVRLQTSEIETIIHDTNELEGLSQLVSSDPSLQQEYDREVAKLDQLLKHAEDKAYLSGKYDASFAILSIHSGQGGTEAMDWASMLFRMYQRFFDQSHWSYQVLDMESGEDDVHRRPGLHGEVVQAFHEGIRIPRLQEREAFGDRKGEADLSVGRVGQAESDQRRPVHAFENAFVGRVLHRLVSENFHDLLVAEQGLEQTEREGKRGGEGE